MFSRNLHLLSFPTTYSLPCFPLKWRSYEFFPEGHGRTPAKVRSNLKSNLTSFGSLWTALYFTLRDCLQARIERDYEKCFASYVIAKLTGSMVRTFCDQKHTKVHVKTGENYQNY